MTEKEIEKILKNKNCKGCSNRCSLLNPGCNRSKIFIDDEIKKYENNNQKKNESNDIFDNYRLF